MFFSFQDHSLSVIAEPLHKNYKRQPPITAISFTTRPHQQMSLRSKNKEKFGQELEQTRAENEELMRMKMGKKKIDLNGRYQKKDVHNILNSLLQGEIIEEDLFNQFWNHYFCNSAHMKDILHAYNTALLMLIENIARKNNRIADLKRDKQLLKQSHDFKNVNMVNLDLDTLQSENAQYRQDLKELSKPFQFNFAPLIENLNLILAKGSKTVQQSKPENLELDGDILKDVLEFAVPEIKQQVSEDLQLNSEQKYHRFALYLGCIALVIDLSMTYNKYNFLDILIGTIFVGNSLLQDYFLKGDFVNRVLQKVDINLVEDRLTVRDAFSAEEVKKVARVVQEKHNFDNYAHSSFLMLSVVLLWDLLWIILMHGPYYRCQDKVFTIETTRCSVFWRYDRYIFYASIYNTTSKAIMLIFMFQMASLSLVRIFSRHNLALFLFRFSDLTQNINQLVQKNK